MENILFTLMERINRHRQWTAGIWQHGDEFSANITILSKLIDYKIWEVS
ncbi:MAG: hypothetical protein H6Q68_3944 [Firmicutes bacterium]|nr:hypothetical protein [Bacillota bacterium]